MGVSLTLTVQLRSVSHSSSFGCSGSPSVGVLRCNVWSLRIKPFSGDLGCTSLSGDLDQAALVPPNGAGGKS